MTIFTVCMCGSGKVRHNVPGNNTNKVSQQSEYLLFLSYIIVSQAFIESNTVN